MNNAPFLPYGRQSIDQDDIDAVVRTLRSDYLTTGPEISSFERDICDYTGAKYAVAVANGTAALHIAVLALDLPEKSVGITTPNTFVATSNALLYAGHKPEFVDIDPRSYTMSTESLKRRFSDTSGTGRQPAVVLPVHFAGHTAGVEEISAIARDNDAYVIEDAAHSIGGHYLDGSRVGSCSHSDMTIFSFHPVKTMTTGEGGAITTNNKDMYERLLMLRTHGITRDPIQLGNNPGPWYYEMQILGFNYRMTDIQAALGRNQLKKLDGFVSRRSELVSRYNHFFSDIPWLITPWEEPGRGTAWHLYVLQFDWKSIGKDRPAVMQQLRELNIGTQVLYIPVPAQPYYRDQLGFLVEDFPVASQYYENSLAIPLYPELTNSDQDRVINAIKALS